MLQQMNNFSLYLIGLFRIAKKALSVAGRDQLTVCCNATT